MITKTSLILLRDREGRELKGKDQKLFFNLVATVRSWLTLAYNRGRLSLGQAFKFWLFCGTKVWLLQRLS